METRRKRPGAMKIDKPCYALYFADMNKIRDVRNEALGLSASERATLAHELILSLDDSASYDLGPAQEDEIQRRLQLVRDGIATGRSPGEVYAEIRAKYS